MAMFPFYSLSSILEMCLCTLWGMEAPCTPPGGRSKISWPYFGSLHMFYTECKLWITIWFFNCPNRAVQAVSIVPKVKIGFMRVLLLLKIQKSSMWFSCSVDAYFLLDWNQRCVQEMLCPAAVWLEAPDIWLVFAWRFDKFHQIQFISC